MSAQNSIGQINLASAGDALPLRVDFESFLAFSYEFAEELQDVIARFRNDSTPVLATVDYTGRISSPHETMAPSIVE